MQGDSMSVPVVVSKDSSVMHDLIAKKSFQPTIFGGIPNGGISYIPSTLKP
jgi:hypothetical protein